MTDAARQIQQTLSTVARQLLIASDALAYDLTTRHPDLPATIAQAKQAATTAIENLRHLP